MFVVGNLYDMMGHSFNRSFPGIYLELEALFNLSRKLFKKKYNYIGFVLVMCYLGLLKSCMKNNYESIQFWKMKIKNF